MINVIKAGDLIRLPSGNVVIVIARQGKEWLCQYAEGARARGEVVFASTFLQHWGRRA